MTEEILPPSPPNKYKEYEIEETIEQYTFTNIFKPTEEDKHAEEKRRTQKKSDEITKPILQPTIECDNNKEERKPNTPDSESDGLLKTDKSQSRHNNRRETEEWRIDRRDTINIEWLYLLEDIV